MLLDPTVQQKRLKLEQPETDANSRPSNFDELTEKHTIELKPIRELEDIIVPKSHIKVLIDGIDTQCETDGTWIKTVDQNRDIQIINNDPTNVVGSNFF